MLLLLPWLLMEVPWESHPESRKGILVRRLEMPFSFWVELQVFPPGVLEKGVPVSLPILVLGPEAFQQLLRRLLVALQFEQLQPLLRPWPPR